MRRVEHSRVIVLFLAPLAVLGACGGSDSSSAGEPRVSSPAASATGGSCIAGYAGNPCGLLTEDLVRAHVPAAPAQIERTDIAERLASLGMHVDSVGGIAQNGCRYDWDGGRTRTRQISLGPESNSAIADALQGLNSNLPVDDTVAFNSIRVLEHEDPVARFERKWSTPTAEDRARLAQAIDEKMDEAREEGQLGEPGAEAGSDIGRSLAEMPIRFEAVEGVGTAARWGGLGNERELMVLDGNTEFAVAVDVADNEAKNREVAIVLARDLLTRCDQ